MFSGNVLIIDDQHVHFLRIDEACHRRLVFTVPDRNHHRKCSAFSLHRFHGNRAVHERHDIFRDRHAETGASVDVAAAAVFLRKGIEDPRQERFIHADARITDHELQRGLVIEYRRAFDDHLHHARRFRKLDRVAENIDENLLELHVIADVIIADAARHRAFIFQSFFLALRHDHGIDLFQHVPEGELFIPEDHASGLNAAHVKNVIDQSQQMTGAFSDLCKIRPGFIRQLFIPHRKAVQTDDRIHRGSDLMTHVGQECRLCTVCLFGSRKRITEHLFLCHILAHLCIDIREAHADRMHAVVIPIFHMPDARHPQHRVPLLPVSDFQEPICDERLFQKFFPDPFRTYEIRKAFLIAFRDMPFTELPENLLIGEMLSGTRGFLEQFVRQITDRLVFIEVHIVDAAVIRGERHNHVVLLLALFLFRNQTVLERNLRFHFLLLRLGRLHAGNFGNVHTHAKRAESAVFIIEFQFCGLKIPDHGSGGIRHILKEDIRFIHGERLLIIFHKMGCRLRVKNIKVRKTDNFFRRLLVCVFRKRLIARKIDTGLCVLGETHGRHI